VNRRGWLVLILAVVGLFRRRGEKPEPDPMVAPGPSQPRAEAVVIVLLLLAALAAAAFVVLYALEGSTQALGGALAGALGLIAAALMVTAKHLVVEEELPEEYPEPQPDEQAAVARIVTDSGSRITRKRLLGAAAGTAGGALGAALVTPAVSLGPLFDPRSLYETPWRRGVRLVDSRGEPLLAADIATDTFYTAYPEGAARDQLGAPLVLVRVDEAALELPAGREGWAPQGILAFSKICTHAGCAVSLYRTPHFAPVQPRPALVCPCHYSTFEPATGGRVLFGPAGRPLPQLPLMVNAAGELAAAGRFSGAIGPAWSGVRQRPPEA
jgi:ubiquinol-cytochrome c reductase iron-sulfur subunit